MNTKIITLARKAVYYACVVACAIVACLYLLMIKTLYGLNKESERDEREVRELIAAKAPVEDFEKILGEPRHDYTSLDQVKIWQMGLPDPKGEKRIVIFYKKGMPYYIKVALTYSLDGKLLEGHVE